jgi:ribonuclease P protein component
MQRKFRLHRSNEIQRVRRTGKSYAHPLVVLIASPNGEAVRRVAVSVSKSVGNAVVRNRARRRIREAVRGMVGRLSDGWDFLLLARPAVTAAKYEELVHAIQSNFHKAGVYHDEEQPPDRRG